MAKAGGAGGERFVALTECKIHSFIKGPVVSSEGRGGKGGPWQRRPSAAPGALMAAAGAE